MISRQRWCFASVIGIAIGTVSPPLLASFVAAPGRFESSATTIFTAMLFGPFADYVLTPRSNEILPGVIGAVCGCSIALSFFVRKACPLVTIAGFVCLYGFGLFVLFARSY
jgi:hypothetical protein